MRTGLRVPSGWMGAKRLRRILPEQRMIVVREASEFDETVLDGDLRYRDRRWIAVSEDGMNGTKPFVAQERDRSHAENVVKRAVQTAPRNAQLRADFGNVDRTKAGRIEIIADLADQLRRCGQRPSGVRRQ